MLPEVVVVHGDPYAINAVRAACFARSLSVRIYANAEDFLKDGSPIVTRYLILDIFLPGMSGIDLLDQLALRGIKPSCIILTAHGSVATCARAFKQGVVDFIEAPFETESLAGALDAAIDLDVVSRKAAAQNEHILACLKSLTNRQREVLSLVSAGHSMKEIAKELRVSQQTIARHRARIFRIFHVTNEVALVRHLGNAGYFDDR